MCQQGFSSIANLFCNPTSDDLAQAGLVLLTCGSTVAFCLYHSFSISTWLSDASFWLGIMLAFVADFRLRQWRIEIQCNSCQQPVGGAIGLQLLALQHHCTAAPHYMLTHTPRDVKVRHAPDNSGSDPCSVIRLQCKFSQLLKPARLSSVMFAYVCRKKLLPLPLRIGMCVVTWKPPSHTLVLSPVFNKRRVILRC